MRLRNERDGIATPTAQPKSEGPSIVVVVGTTLAVVFVVVMITLKNELR